MSEFWANNKDSIYSGLKTAGKHTYNGTKYVAKTGYQVGKSQYNDHKNNKKKGNSGNNSNEDISREPSSIENLNDPRNFPPPPLKPGQMQYQSGGSITVGDGSSGQASPITSLGVTPNQSFQSLPSQGSYGRPAFGNPNSSTSLQQGQFQQQQQPTLPQRKHMQVIQPQPMQQGEFQEEQLKDLQPGNQFEQGFQYTHPMEQAQFQQPNVVHVQHSQMVPNQNRAQPPVPPQRNLASASQTSIPPRTQPSIPVRAQPDIPTEDSENDSSPDIDPHLAALAASGPQYEVKPFDAESYKQMKDEKKIKIPELDVSKLEPPPKHTDRGTNIRPATKSVAPDNKTKSTISNHSFSHTLGSLSDYSSSTSSNMPITLTDETEDGSTSHEEKEHQHIGIIGEYQEPTTTFAPPPKPFRIGDVTPPSRNPYSPTPPSRTRTTPSFSATGAAINAVTPPPVLPRRSTSSLTKSNEKEVNEVNTANHGITGEYIGAPVNFQPPPKPFRRLDQQDNSKRTSLSSKSTESNTPVSLTASRDKSNPPQPLQRPVTDDSIVNTTKDLGGLTVNEPSPISFDPPPKPFRRNTEPQNVNERGKTPPVVPIKKPVFIPSENSLNKDNKQSNSPAADYSNREIKPATAFAPPPKPFKKVETPVESQDEDEFMDAQEEVYVPTSVTPKKKTPPPIKPKPKTLNKNIEGQSTKRPPPLIKPKPKNFQLSERVTEKLSYQEPKSIIMTAEDYNPFAIYKKDAVPAEEDRIHKKV